MKRKIIGAIAAAALGCLGNAAWAQDDAPGTITQMLPPGQNQVEMLPQAGDQAPPPKQIDPPMVEAEPAQPPMTVQPPIEVQTPMDVQPPMEVQSSPGAANPMYLTESFMGDSFREPSNRGGLIGGFGLYFIQPSFNSNPSLSVQTVRTKAGATSTTEELHGFRYSLDAAPEFWLGYVSDCGLGAQIRYFGFAASANDSFVVPAPTADTTTTISTVVSNIDSDKIGSGSVRNDLKVHVWDFVVTQDWRPGSWTFQGGIGLRYAHFAQDYISDLRVRNGLVIGAAGSDHLSVGGNFNGAGPLAIGQAKLPLGDTGLALYGITRGALLFGTSKTNSHESYFGNVGLATESTEDSSSHNTNVIPVGEVELGAEYGADLGRTRLLVQLGVDGQIYFGASGTAIPEAGQLFSSNFGFVGINVRTGIEY